MRRAAAMIGIASRAPDTTSRVFAGARSVCMARRAPQPRAGSPPRARIGRARRGLEARRLGARPDGREPGVQTRGRHALPRRDDRGRGARGGLLARRDGPAPPPARCRPPPRLDALAARLAAAFPGARFQGYVDTGPVLEREWAMRAGLGWIGKHTLLLDRAAGSYFFLAELFTDLELAASPLPADHCGTCARC